MLNGMPFSWPAKIVVTLAFAKSKAPAMRPAAPAAPLVMRLISTSSPYFLKMPAFCA